MPADFRAGGTSENKRCPLVGKNYTVKCLPLYLKPLHPDFDAFVGKFNAALILLHVAK